MKMNNAHPIKQLFACVMILCLAATDLGVEPAQASPPAGSYEASVRIVNLVKELCLNQTYTFEGYFVIENRAGLSERLVNPTASLDSDLSPTDPGIMTWSWVDLGEVQRFSFKYKAEKEGDEHVKITIFYPGDFGPGEPGTKIGGITIDFKVKPCNISLHGTADVGAVANALSPDSTWNFVGTYDVAGRVELNEEGSANGQGTSSLFMDGIAAAPLVTCGFTSPIEGNTAIEVEADPDAWANEGALKLQIHLEPMPVNFGGIGCTTFGNTINTGSAAETLASFDLNFPPLPANGGTTSLEFQLPGQPGTYKMDLIVSLEVES